MQPLRSLRALTLTLVLAGLLVPSGLRAAGAAAAVQAPPYAELIGAWPRPGSEAYQSDRAILLWLQAARTREEVARAQAEASPRLGLFSAAAGADLESPQYRRTKALCDAMAADLRRVTGPLKDYYARPRPYLAMADITPAVTRPYGASYPSEHSCWGVSQSLLLSELQPGRRQQLLERGLQIGFDRVLGGVHHPTDVQAGQKLGTILGEAWLADPGHREQLESVRAIEWQR
jgi:acid phosphatase (class A)